MKKWLKDLFAESSDVSMMRVMSLLSLLIGGYLALKGDTANVAIFVGAAFTGKVVQKNIEVSANSAKITETKE